MERVYNWLNKQYSKHNHPNNKKEYKIETVEFMPH